MAEGDKIAKRGDTYDRFTRAWIRTLSTENRAKLSERVKEQVGHTPNLEELVNYVSENYTTKQQTENGKLLNIDRQHAQPEPHEGDTIRSIKIDFDKLI